MVNETFKVWLQTEMKNRDWSYRDLAEESGLSIALTSMVLSGQRALTWDYCASVARAFGYSPVKVFLLAGLLQQSDLEGVAVDVPLEVPNR